MSLDDKAAKTVARLARLSLGGDAASDAETEAMVSEFAKIVGYMDILGEADAKGVEPMYSPMIDPQPARPDIPREDPSKADEILAQAPELVGRFFSVPKIV
ncbi:MAG: Asp-tRNA(Asn)/Glu-tRNA(Gln) amidotransferase subunit GatC [Deltaproteobacteria bacterium]|jgi:aspartyl/glutamyl-tRNA(Asn/Gln) amidotransferase C subunit|nr:Asp-tRNA(Asn)/Glu-tRNA(Gln) amidotransferase subunit GatC [Deltaproteobacteria bacterium]